MGEICAIRMFGPSHCFQRSQCASRSMRVRHLLQSLATAPLVGPGSSMRRGKAPPSASMPKDHRGTCARRVTPHLQHCCMTSLCAPHPKWQGSELSVYSSIISPTRGTPKTARPRPAVIVISVHERLDHRGEVEVKHQISAPRRCGFRLDSTIWGRPRSSSPAQ